MHCLTKSLCSPTRPIQRLLSLSSTEQPRWRRYVIMHLRLRKADAMSRDGGNQNNAPHLNHRSSNSLRTKKGAGGINGEYGLEVAGVTSIACIVLDTPAKQRSISMPLSSSTALVTTSATAPPITMALPTTARSLGP